MAFTTRTYPFEILAFWDDMPNASLLILLLDNVKKTGIYYSGDKLFLRRRLHSRTTAMYTNR